eukprot:7323379-Alexandrium_andersonii.AAC.1
MAMFFLPNVAAQRCDARARSRALSRVEGFVRENVGVEVAALLEGALPATSTAYVNGVTQ